jgi:cytosine/adenosine deaminase-related metal-dependent hydrolase
VAGAPADFLVLDLDRLDPDHIMDVDPLDYVFARATARHIAEVVVAGRTIVEDGRVTGIDLDAVHADLRAQYRKGMPDRAPFLAAWSDIEPAAATYFRGMSGCC